MKKKSDFKKATLNDSDLQTIVKYLVDGWPENKKVLSHCARNFFKIKDSLCVSDNLLFFNNKLVVPYSLRKEILLKLHEGHIGIDKTKHRAREIFYWPGMSQDIENFIKQCKICEKFCRRNCKETIIPYEIPSRPWERLGTDIFTYSNQSYLVIIDAYSNWLEVVPIKDKSTLEVISKFKLIFSTFGCPDTLISDNIPFGSCLFKEFAKNWNFNIITRSANYPRSNGLAEKGVGIAKLLLKKSIEEGKSMCEALLQYRNTPLKTINYSPSQLLMSRICKTKLPISAELLKPTLCTGVYNKQKIRQVNNKNYFNKHTKDLKELSPGQNVVIFNPVKNYWEPGKIVKLDNKPRCYKVLDKLGNIVSRNRVDIKESANDFSEDTFEDFTEQVVKQNSPPPCSSVQSNPELPQNLPKTRSGRFIKKPLKLDL